jgi:hypothetical protein
MADMQAKLIEAGVPRHRLAELPENVQEYFGPFEMMRGHMVKALRRSVLDGIGEKYPTLKQVPVCFIPSRELNAFAIAAPGKVPVICLNHCIMAMVPHIIGALLAHSSWHTDVPWSRDHSQSFSRIRLAQGSGLSRRTQTNGGRFTHTPPYMENGQLKVTSTL